MAVIKEYLFVFIVSGEFLILLVGTAFGLIWPAALTYLGSKLNTSDKVVEYIALLPTALFVWNLNECRKLLFPEEDKQRLLQKWPDYWRLKARFHVALIYTFIFSILGIGSWMLGFSLNDPRQLAMFLSAVFGAVVVATSVYLAKIRIDEIFAESK